MIPPSSSPAPSLASSPALTFDIDLIPDAITALAPGTIINYAVLVVIDLHTTFYYGKVVMTKDLTSLKLYIKGTIWIGGILFNNITEA